MPCTEVLTVPSASRSSADFLGCAQPFAGVGSSHRQSRSAAPDAAGTTAEPQSVLRTAGTSREETNARIKNSSLCSCYFDGAVGADTQGRCANFRHHRRAAPRMPVRLLRLCSVCLRASGLLRPGLLLQRYLSRRGTMGLLGLSPRLGQPPLPWRRRRTLSRRPQSRISRQAI